MFVNFFLFQTLHEDVADIFISTLCIVIATSLNNRHHLSGALVAALGREECVGGVQSTILGGGGQATILGGGQIGPSLNGVRENVAPHSITTYLHNQLNLFLTPCLPDNSLSTFY